MIIMAVILETSLGDITVDLYTDERPRCCLNFLKLCKMKYYNFSLFHSVQRNLVAQTGDPTGSGKGGSSVFGTLYGDQARYFEAEMKPRIKHTKLGTLSMANNGENMHGSQFFMTLATDIDYLDNKHTVFGEVAEGFEVLQKFNEAFTDQEGRPYKDIRIFHTVVLDDPFDDPEGLSAYVPDRSPEPTKEQLDSGRIGVDENIDDFEGKTEEEIQELVEEREAKARTQILEMVGDIPDADAAPPDNVLFVCKLNPVTTAEDLEIIFSRFGNIESCEVIKDQKTEESLQYAFIEFEKPEDCENAYFKMDNVLIDDRRIHVDFSQSVAKLKWKGKGKGVERLRKDDGDNDDDKPQFRIKDNKRKDNYNLVFDDEPSPDGESDRQHKKKTKTHKRDNSQERRTRKKDKKHRSPSISPRHDRYRDDVESRYRKNHSGSHKHKKHKRDDSSDRGSHRERHYRDQYDEKSHRNYRSRSRDRRRMDYDSRREDRKNNTKYNH